MLIHKYKGKNNFSRFIGRKVASCALILKDGHDVDYLTWSLLWCDQC